MYVPGTCLSTGNLETSTLSAECLFQSKQGSFGFRICLSRFDLQCLHRDYPEQLYTSNLRTFHLPKTEVLTYISCISSAYARGNPPHKIAKNMVQDSYILGTWNCWWSNMLPAFFTETWSFQIAGSLRSNVWTLQLGGVNEPVFLHGCIYRSSK